MSMKVGAFVTLIAAVQYLYMREFLVVIHVPPILNRYVDWSITFLVQMIELYLIPSAAGSKIKNKNSSCPIEWIPNNMSTKEVVEQMLNVQNNNLACLD